MSNQNYSEFSTRRANKNKGAGGPKGRKGTLGAEHDAPHKDNTVTWPGAPGSTRPNFNKTGIHQVKTVVACDGVQCGGQDYFTK